MRPANKITAESENFRLEGGFIKRDPVEPEPVGTIVLKVFRVTGYDSDCDGSLMARMENIDSQGAVIRSAPETDRRRLCRRRHQGLRIRQRAISQFDQIPRNRRQAQEIR